MLRGVVDGWRELLTVAVPTGVAGALLVPPLIIGSVGVVLAGVLAATRRPALALLVPAASATLFALLGSQQADRLHRRRGGRCDGHRRGELGGLGGHPNEAPDSGPCGRRKRGGPSRRHAGPASR